MLYAEYTRHRDVLLQQYPASLHLATDELLQTQFILVSAGLKNYLPGIPYREHERIFKNIFLHQQLSMLEQHCTSLPDFIHYENLTATHRDLMRKGCIICTYHTGSYRAINVWLIKQKIPFALVINNRMFNEQGQQLKDIFTKQNNNHNDPAFFSIINAEAPGALVRMIRHLKSGKTLVLYADGNTGSGNDNAANTNCCDISFLQQHIYARTGIAYLALATGVPVLPVISYRKTISDIYLQFQEPVQISHNDIKINKETLVADITQHLFRLLSVIVQQYPEQWESWLYLHNMVNIALPESREDNNGLATMHGNSTIRFNSADFGIFNAGNTYYLFSKAQYLAYPIDRELYKQLRTSILTPVKKKNFKAEIIKELVNNGVLLST